MYRGRRPGAQWHGHGTFARKLFTLRAGELVRITVHKQRWRLAGTTQTRHSRPPDDVGSCWFCSLIVATSLWEWVCGEEGLHRRTPTLAALRRVRAAGIPVVVASRVPTGRIVPLYANNIDLLNIGAVQADNQSPWKARVLLMIAMTRTRDTERLRAIFDR